MDHEEPSLEEIKKFTDEKRKGIKRVSPELQKKRLENLAKGRETRKQKLLEKKNENVILPEEVLKEVVKEEVKESLKNKKKIILEDDDDEIELKKPLKREVSVNNLKEFNTVFKSLNNIKELIDKQRDFLTESVKIKPKKTKPVKEKKVIKTLDLTVDDKEINDILNISVNNVKAVEAVDPKLQEFLEAFKKR